MAKTADTAWSDGSIADPYSDAVLSVKPGDRIRIETRTVAAGIHRSGGILKSYLAPAKAAQGA